MKTQPILKFEFSTWFSTLILVAVFFAIDGWEAKVVLENFQIILFSFQDKAAPTCWSVASQPHICLACKRVRSWVQSPYIKKTVTPICVGTALLVSELQDQIFSLNSEQHWAPTKWADNSCFNVDIICNFSEKLISLPGCWGSVGFSWDGVQLGGWEAQPGALGAPVARNGGQERSPRRWQPITDWYLSLSLRIPESGPATQCGDKNRSGNDLVNPGFSSHKRTLAFVLCLIWIQAWLGPTRRAELVTLLYWNRGAYSIRWITLCPAHCSTTIVCWLCAVVAGRGGRGFVAKVCIFQNNCHSPASTSYICTFCCHSNVDRQKYSRIFCKGGENVGRWDAKEVCCRLGRWIVWADIVSDLFVITRNWFRSGAKKKADMRLGGWMDWALVTLF